MVRATCHERACYWRLMVFSSTCGPHSFRARMRSLATRCVAQLALLIQGARASRAAAALRVRLSSLAHLASRQGGPCVQWLDAGHGDCPVCKAGVSRDNVTPIYGRGGAPSDPRCVRGCGVGDTAEWLRRG